MDFPMRINKYLAHKGFATRKGADALVEAGTVYVNDKRAVIGQQIAATDRVEIRNAPTQSFRYVLYNKPRGIITHSPESHEVDIVTKIAKDHGITGLFPIGRLDKDSEGLMLLTDDGRMTERILSPDAEHEKEYEVTVDKKVTNSFLKQLSQGVRIERYLTKPAHAEATKNDDRVFHITLTEGKKHQVRRMCAALGYQVQSLKRIRIMHLELKRLAPGQVYTLKKPEVYELYNSLGLHTPKKHRKAETK